MKILHISDLHFGYYQQNIIEQFKIFTQEYQPDLILITGDLTHRAKTSQFKDVATFIKDLNTKVISVPGNHDIPLYKFTDRFANPFHSYKEYISKDLEPVFENDLLKIIGLNSVNPYSIKKGKINTRQINHIRSSLSHDGKWNMLMCHHNITQIENLHKFMPCADDLAEISQQNTIHMICTGHLHYSCIKPLTDQEKFPIVAHTGSLSCKRTNDQNNNFFCFNISATKLQIDDYVFKDGTFHKNKTFSIDK